MKPLIRRRALGLFFLATLSCTQAYGLVDVLIGYVIGRWHEQSKHNPKSLQKRATRLHQQRNRYLFGINSIDLEIEQCNKLIEKISIANTHGITTTTPIGKYDRSIHRLRKRKNRLELYIDNIDVELDAIEMTLHSRQTTSTMTHTNTTPGLMQKSV